jgi:DNA repair exonuclease SbcCD ATPase subunit
MPNLKFKRLLILSNSTKTANQFEFSETLNLITAIDNSVGKSTLVKLLFWGIGCEPTLDTNWGTTDSKTILEFTVDTTLYVVKRYKNSISLKIEGSEFINYDKITGEYSKKLAEILEFKALLPNRSSGLMEVPPPAFYFLPFYIDQRRSWSKAWDNFENLEQYSNWRSTIVKYHVGLLSPKHFDLENDKAENKDLKRVVEVQIDKIETTLEIVEDYIPQITNTITEAKEFEILTEEIKIDLQKLQEEQEKILSQLTIFNGDRVYLEQQQVITEKIISELDKDYKFTIENIEDDEVECPLCGIVHENSIINRTSIMTDKSQAENQLESILTELDKVNKKLTNSNHNLIKARENINHINEKYTISEEVSSSQNLEDNSQNSIEKRNINFNQIIENIAGNSIKKNVLKDKAQKVNSVDTFKKEIRRIGKEQKGLITPDDIEEINNSFSSIFSDYIELLDAEAVNISDISSPLDYNKVIKEGGAAESSRGILAYYLSVFTMVEKYGNEVKSALVIDTPNQHEQSDTNYEKIVSLLTNKTSEETQILLCAMENEHLEQFKKKAKIITLTKDKLMLKSEYENVKEIFDGSSPAANNV